ncbi:unnamed protein product [Arabidopsis lyrata]|nr:unnamed protein product [Arabidopsis lyrata]
MADWLLLIPWNKIFTAACGCFLSDRNYIHLMESNLDALETTMDELKNRRDDLLGRVAIEEDKGLQRLAQVNGWLSRVKSVESQFNDMLAARSTETGRLCLFGYCSNDCVSSYNYGQKAEKKHIQTTIGLDTMVGNVWESLMNDEIRTLGLYGMGGVGKTTLLACINNKFVELESEFDVVIWVVVSKEFQFEGIQDQILGRIRLDKEWERETENKKASLINNNLKRKKFVLLLDDIWSKVDLYKIGVPPPTRENGSKIVFTRRSKEVCKYMKADEQIKVDCLSPVEAWELFRITIGDIILSSHQDIPALARIVAAKCHGLPLALNVIGETMACKDTIQEWRHAINVLNSPGHKFPVGFFRVMPKLVVLDLSTNMSLIELPEEISNLCSLQYLNLSSTRIKSLPVGKLRKLIYLNLEFSYKLESLVGIAATLPNLQVLKLFYSHVCVDDRLMEELEHLEHMKILAVTIEDAMILERIQGMDRLASSIRSLCLINMSTPRVILSTTALGSLQQLAVRSCNISEITIDWESKERRELSPMEIHPSTSSPGFKLLSTDNIMKLVGPRDLLPCV